MDNLLKLIEIVDPVTLVAIGVMLWFFYQHLNVKINKLDTKIDNVEKSFNEKIDNVETNLNENIDKVEKSLNEKIDNFKECLNDRIELAQDKLGSRIDSLYGFMFTVCGLRRPNEGNDRGEQNQVA